MAQPLQPTLKERKRYIVYEPAQEKLVLNAHKELFGTQGLARAGILAVQTTNGKGILRVAHTCQDELTAALIWSGASTITVAGTLRKAREAILQT